MLIVVYKRKHCNPCQWKGRQPFLQFAPAQPSQKLSHTLISKLMLQIHHYLQHLADPAPPAHQHHLQNHNLVVAPWHKALDPLAPICGK